MKRAAGSTSLSRTWAFYYERELERQIGILTSMVEPILILAVGGVVGFIVFAMMLPIFEMSRAIIK